MKLAGARTLITGASGGLGAAIARACAAEQAEVTITGRNEAALRDLAAATGARVVVADLADPRDVTQLLDNVGDIDVLVSNAALPASGRIETFTPVEIDRALNVNLRAPMIISSAVTRGMAARRRGHVVFVSSLAAAFPTPGLSIYNATKAALSSYALSLRGELDRDGVGVSIIHPGPIRDAGMWADAGVATPKGLRTRSPEDVAAAVVGVVEHNKAEATVAPLALRVGAVIGRAFPATVGRVAPRLGADELTEAMTDALRDKR